MKVFKITMYVLLTVTLTIIAVYALSQVDRNGLVTERSILLQVIDKDRLIERKLREQNTNLTVKLASFADKISVVKDRKGKNDLLPAAVEQKRGNRGFLFMKSGPRQAGGEE